MTEHTAETVALAPASDRLIVDLFAGPGGWSEGLRAHGVADIGIEWDEAACRTRAAAGHLTIRADVSQYPTAPFIGRTWGVIASPPCTAFSNAGKGLGTVVIDDLVAAIQACDWSALREHPATVWLPLEVGRWVDALRPSWLACEQVPPALPLWEAYQPWLRSLGYSTWAGVLNAADYGVPQTRQRAFLMASRERAAVPPEPTHSREPEPGLFGTRRPWVSMAEALGWGMTERPVVTLTAGSNRQGGVCPLDGGSGARAAIQREREREREVVGYRRSRGSGMTERHGERPDTPITEPAPTVTSKWRSDEWIELDRRQNGAPPLDPRLVPSPTLTGAAIGKGIWVVRTGTNSMKHSRKNEDMVKYERDVTEPAPTVDAKAGGAWTVTRPATTVCADPRISPPGYRGRPEDYADDGTYLGERSMDRAIKITEADALTLQSFRPDYPLQGSRSKRFEQVGNAVPPALAAAIIGALVVS